MQPEFLIVEPFIIVNNHLSRDHRRNLLVILILDYSVGNLVLLSVGYFIEMVQMG